MNFENEKYLFEQCKNIGVELSDYQIEKIARFYDLLIEKNKVMNLTTITDEKEFLDKHIIDSLQTVPYIIQDAKICDVGCGGGFPSVPLKIAREDISLLSIDSTKKKVDFVADCEKELNLENAKTMSVRAEVFGQGEGRAKFDVVVSRAVANINVLLELCLPLLKVGGKFFAYKSHEAEMENINNAVKMLGAVQSDKIECTLPNGDKRNIYVFEKTKSTDKKYPRNFGQMKKKPL